MTDAPRTTRWLSAELLFFTLALLPVACDGDVQTPPTDPATESSAGAAGADGDAVASAAGGEAGSAEPTATGGTIGQAGNSSGDVRGGADGVGDGAGEGGGAGAELVGDRSCVTDVDCVHVEYPRSVTEPEECECPLCPGDFGRLPPINRGAHEANEASFAALCGELECPPLPCTVPEPPRCDASVCIAPDPPVVDPTQ